MAFVEVNPAYRALLERHGLTCADRFLALPAVIVSGHPDRNVARVTLQGDTPFHAYLKREHRIPWRDRLANLWAGLRSASKSYREGRTLQALRRAGVACPEVV